MSTATDVITIEEASQAAAVSLGTLGYWIIAGMLDANVTPVGRVVRLSDVRRVAGQLNPAAQPAREAMLQEDRVIDTTQPAHQAAPARDDLFSEVRERLERLDQQLQRVDQTLMGQIGQVDRIDAARSRDAESLQRVQLTLEQHAEALRRLEAQQVIVSAPQQSPTHRHQPPAPMTEPSMVLRFRPLTPSAATEPAPPAASAPTLRMRAVSGVRLSAPAQPVAARPFGLRLSLPRLPFAQRKPVGDNS